MKENGFLNEHFVTKIDVSDGKNLVFVMEDGLEVKIGNSDFGDRLEQLNKTLGSIVVDKSNITYIDLRFTEVVLGTK
jgi:cell division septal protein FtsQ